MASEENTLAPNTRVIIATNNFGVPSRAYLQRFEERVDNVVKNRLRENGFSIVSSRLYDAAYAEAISKFGNPFNSSTGNLNSERLGNVLGYTFHQLKQDNAADAIIFTDLVAKETAVIRSDSKRFTRFDGVQRKMKIQGAGGSVGENFDWNANIDVASLAINLFTIDGARILHNMGGLDNADAINTRKNSFSRSRTLMKDDKFIIEAVELALHPVIFSDLYVEQRQQQ